MVKQSSNFTPDGTYLKGSASPRGVHPFLDWVDLDTSETKRFGNQGIPIMNRL